MIQEAHIQQYSTRAGLDLNAFQFEVGNSFNL